MVEQERLVAEASERSDTTARDQGYLRAVLDNAVDGLITINAEGIVRSFNSAAERIFGYRAEQVIGQNVSMLMPEPHKTAHHTYLTDFHSTRQPKIIGRGGRELPARRADGTIFPIELGVSEVQLSGDQFFVGFVKDISERKQVEAALLRASQRAQLVIESVPNGILVVNRDGFITLVNSTATKLFGYERAELVGQPVEMLLPTSLRKAHPGQRTGFFRNPQARAMGTGRDLFAIRKDGSEFPVEIGLSPIETDGEMSVLCSIVDITERKQTELALRGAVERAQLIIESAPNGILVINRDGVITLVNSSATKLFGYERAEVVGQPVEMLLPTSMREGHPAQRTGFFRDPQARAMGTGRDLFAIRKDGSEFPVEIGLNPIETDGELSVLCSIVDITERKRAESALRDYASHLSSVMNTVVDGLITIDESGTIHSFNPAAEKIFGYTEVEAIGKNVKFLMPEPYHSAHDGYLSQYKATGVKSIIGAGREVSAKRKDGSVFPMELGVSEMFLHDRRMYVGILRDVTLRREAEHVRLNLISNLQASNQELDDFAYIASHDLKEPLRGLHNNALFLKEDYESQLDAGGIRRIDRICYLCKRMERLIDDLLHFSRLNRQGFAHKPTDLNEVLHDITDQLDIASDPALTLRVPAPLPALVCDATRIGEVLRNLITNAIKYNDKPSKLIEVGRVAEQDGERNVFFVRDNGIGIPHELQNEVFTIFRRLQPEDDKVRGSGVGLTFAKKIVERHGGRIWLESEVGKGTTFFFTMKEAKAS